MSGWEIGGNGRRRQPAGVRPDGRHDIDPREVEFTAPQLTIRCAAIMAVSTSPFHPM